ncbi:hypothetical protein C0L75_03270 [Clostridium perfringens]
MKIIKAISENDGKKTLRLELPLKDYNEIKIGISNPFFLSEIIKEKVKIELNKIVDKSLISEINLTNKYCNPNTSCCVFDGVFDDIHNILELVIDTGFTINLSEQLKREIETKDKQIISLRHFILEQQRKIEKLEESLFIKDSNNLTLDFKEKEIWIEENF